MGQGTVAHDQAMASVDTQVQSSAMEVVVPSRTCSRNAPLSFPTQRPSRASRPASGHTARRSDCPSSHPCSSKSALDVSLWLGRFDFLVVGCASSAAVSTAQKSDLCLVTGEDSFLHLLLLMGWKIKIHSLWEIPVSE